MPGHDIAIASLGPLTPREAEAVLWTAEGKTAWEAGTILGITSRTMDAHIAHAAEKLEASNRAHLVARAFVTGVLVVIAKGAALVLVLAMAIGNHDGARVQRVRLRRSREDIVTAVVSRVPGGGAA